jgi:hypothetical protein
MTRYDEISKLALSILDNAEYVQKQSIDDLIDILETTQEILADNTGDDRLTKAINIYRNVIHQELELRDKDRYK